MLFKEEHIYKVYGDKPSNFQVMGSASLGVEAGSDASIAIAGETLFYLARTGIVAYSGGIPQQVGAAFGTQRFRNAVGGSDGTKYYVSMKDTDDAWHLLRMTRCGACGTGKMRWRLSAGAGTGSCISWLQTEGFC